EDYEVEMLCAAGGPDITPKRMLPAAVRQARRSRRDLVVDLGVPSPLAHACDCDAGEHPGPGKRIGVEKRLRSGTIVYVDDQPRTERLAAIVRLQLPGKHEDVLALQQIRTVLPGFGRTHLCHSGFVDAMDGPQHGSS